MTDEKRRAKVDQFIVEQIDSVPHLEALLLLWNSRPNPWSSERMARALYVRTDVASKILAGLVQRELIVADDDSFRCEEHSPETSQLLGDLDAIYRKEVVRISSIIHSKASAGVRDFAKAFRFTKEDQ
ncbi:MAG TPA: hypothetical protein VN577_20795 [Terriglobales bacterium]|nr:hypothetical protein [Terriglobales bacterium]